VLNVKKLKSAFPDIEIKEIDLMSQKGISLVTKYGIMANPGIIINDEFFSAGNLDKAKFFSRISSLIPFHSKTL